MSFEYKPTFPLKILSFSEHVLGKNSYSKNLKRFALTGAFEGVIAL